MGFCNVCRLVFRVQRQYCASVMREIAALKSQLENHSVDTSPSADAWCVSKHFEQQQQLLQGVGGLWGQ